MRAPATEWSSTRPLAMSCRNSATWSTSQLPGWIVRMRSLASPYSGLAPVSISASAPVQRNRVEGQHMTLRQAEHADEVDRVVREHLRIGDVDAIVVDHEIGALAQHLSSARPQPRHHAVEHRNRLSLS